MLSQISSVGPIEEVRKKEGRIEKNDRGRYLEGGGWGAPYSSDLSLHYLLSGKKTRFGESDVKWGKKQETIRS